MSKITIIPFSDRLFFQNVKCTLRISPNETCLCYNAGQSGGDFITLKHFKKWNRKMLKMLSFQPPKCSSGLLTKARRRNSLCGSIQLNGCTVQQVAWQGYRGRREREDGGQQCSSEFNFLPLLSIGEWRASIYRQLDDSVLDGKSWNCGFQSLCALQCSDFNVTLYINDQTLSIWFSQNCFEASPSTIFCFLKSHVSGTLW